ncbi:MAG: hypothetical protein ABIS86_19880 [Streptosporangiaceae bacterium]
MSRDGQRSWMSGTGSAWWVERLRNAERIRQILLEAHMTAWGSTRDGFMVLGGHRGVFFVTCNAGRHTAQSFIEREVVLYTEVLRAAGYQTLPSPEDPGHTIEAWRRESGTA